MHAVVLLLLLLVCSATLLAAQEYRYTASRKTNNGFAGEATLVGSGPYGNDIATIKFDIFLEDTNRLRVRVLDANQSRWQVPNIIQTSTPENAPAQLNYTVELKNDTFGFKVIRNANGDVLFDSSTMPFVYSEQYISIGTILPKNPSIYGLGERVRELKLAYHQNYTIFTKDDPNTYSKNLYGSHPFYLDYRASGNAHGVFLLNSNAMDVALTDTSILFKTIGGVIDLYIFLGPTPDLVMKQYQQVIGLPLLPPYWAFGFHQCRYGYPSLNATKQVVENYRKFGIPLETQWNDIDYMNEYEAFTWDPVRYPQAEMKAFVDELHKNHQHYMVILDPGMKNLTGYEPYDDGLAKNIFIKRYQSDEPIVNKVWPGFTVFPDFFNPNTQAYWTNLISKFAATVDIDGLWLDMNEIATFCNGECDWYPEPVFDHKFDPNNPPYVPGGINLAEKTLRLDAQQYNGLFYYNAHNLYGITSSNATRNALASIKPGKRPFVVTRSTFAGSGHVVHHWTGDNWSTWSSLHLSIPGIINMNMFGLPFVGADICGFLGDTTEELCTRWIQVGSFYPFARDHNDLKSIPQELYVFGEQLVNVSKHVLFNRYSLLPYYYTLFYKVHTEGGAVFRALFFEFPEQYASGIGEIDKQFLVGSALLVSPVLTANTSQVQAYFPPAFWYDYWTGAMVYNDTSKSTVLTLDAPITHINVHIRGGYIVPKQQPAMVLYQARQEPFELLIALNEQASATGQLFMDDGISENSIATGSYLFVNYKFTLDNGNKATLQALPSAVGYKDAEQLVLKKITIYGLPMGATIANLENQKDATIFVNSATGAVIIDNLSGLSMTSAFSVNFGVSTGSNPLWILLASGIVVGLILLIGAMILVYFVVEKIRASKKSTYNPIDE